MPARCSVASDLHLLSLARNSLSLSVLLSNNVRVTRIVRSFFFRASRVSLVGRVKGEGEWNAITPE